MIISSRTCVSKRANRFNSDAGSATREKNDQVAELAHQFFVLYDLKGCWASIAWSLWILERSGVAVEGKAMLETLHLRIFRGEIGLISANRHLLTITMLLSRKHLPASSERHFRPYTSYDRSQQGASPGRVLLKSCYAAEDEL